MDKKQAKCKCGHNLVQSMGFPSWVYCDNPPCDYVVLIGDWMVDSMFGTYSENKFAKDGTFKGHYEGNPLLKKIEDIKKVYIETA